MIPGAFVEAIDWLYSTERTWSRLPVGNRRKQGFLSVAIRLAERQRGPKGTRNMLSQKKVRGGS